MACVAAVTVRGEKGRKRMWAVKPGGRGTGIPSPPASFHLPQVRRANAREPRQDREGSSAKRLHASLRVTWGNFTLLI